MLLIFPPLAKPCEPPAGIARLAGALQAAGKRCTIVDANIEGIFFLLQQDHAPKDTWSRRAVRGLEKNLHNLRNPELYRNHSRYKRAVSDINRVLEQVGKAHGTALSLKKNGDRPCFLRCWRQLTQSTEWPTPLGKKWEHVQIGVCCGLTSGC